MKRLFISLTTLLTFVFFSNSFAQVKPKMPYTATYSSSFTIGKATYAKMILDLWKDWDDNAFDRHDYMADTVVMMLSDGTIVKGKTENLEGAKKYRGSMSSAKSILHAWVPLTSTDIKEDVVCVWGQETDTYPDGRVETRDLHEVWWFNKAGKVSRMRQWTAKFGE